MKADKRRLKYRKERVLLSDVLPFHIPVTFSNRHFYRFCTSHHVELEGLELRWSDAGVAVEAAIKLLFGLKQDTAVQKDDELFRGRMRTVCRIYLSKHQLTAIPFVFRIRHKRGAYRELTLAHPRNQIQIVDFYHRFKELILYYCSVSPFSIRKPIRVSRFTFHKDKTHYDLLARESGHIEEFDKEYENLRSFFVYKSYSNIHKFYESYRFFRAEKKFDRMVKLDISRCFESIYTHSLAWALIDKTAVKQNLTNKHACKTIGHAFDEVMQCVNYNETNGIIIGPEFSRLFAELLLQSVDKETEYRLRQEPYNLHHRRDYEVFRYVDDYFIFFNDDGEKEAIVDELQVHLRSHKLYFNNEKQESFEKPIITPISIAKAELSKLFNERFSYSITKSQKTVGGKVVEEANGSIRIYAKNLKTEFRSILKRSEVEYKDIMNFALAVIESSLTRIFKDYDRIKRVSPHDKARELAAALTNAIEFTFFIYTVSPRVATTIKLCRIVRLCTAFYRRKGANRDLRNTVFKQIYDDTVFVLRKNRLEDYTQVETLYLLLALVELGRDYWLTENDLMTYFRIGESQLAGKARLDLNYFSLTVLMFYIKDKDRYQSLRAMVESEVKARLTDPDRDHSRCAEDRFLLFDVLACPYISDATKDSILEFGGVKSKATRKSVVELNENWFTTWHGFDLGQELEAKRSEEVY